MMKNDAWKGVENDRGTTLKIALAGVAQWIECWPVAKGHRFDSQSGHMPGLQAGSPVGGT